MPWAQTFQVPADRLGFRVSLKVHVPKSVYTLGSMYLYRDYFTANVYTIVTI